MTRYMLTESSLRSLIREAVKSALNEYGDSHPQERYGAAMAAYHKAMSQGRINQAMTFKEFAEKYFNEDYGFDNEREGHFRMADIGDEEYPLSPYHTPSHKESGYTDSLIVGPDGTNYKELYHDRANNMRAHQRNRVKKGLEIWRNYNNRERD